MIVPAMEVQSAPPMVEVQGAAATLQSAPEEFRVAFTASVSRSVARGPQSDGSVAAGSASRSSAADVSKAESSQAARASGTAASVASGSASAATAASALASTLASTLARASSTKKSPAGNGTDLLVSTAGSKASGLRLADADEMQVSEHLAGEPAAAADVAAVRSVSASSGRDAAEGELPEAVDVSAAQVERAAVQGPVIPKTTASPQQGAVSSGRDSARRAGTSSGER